MSTTITPVAAVPATSGALAGSFTAAGRKLRLSAALKRGGSEALTLIRQNGTGYWERTSHVLKLSRSDTDTSGGIASLDVDIETSEVYHVLSTSRFSLSSDNAVVTLEDLAPPSGLADVPDHGSTHTSDSSDPIPAAVAGGRSGLMTGAMAAQLAQLAGATPGAQTLTTNAPDSGAGQIAFTSDNTTALTAGRLWSEKNAGVEKFAIRYDGGAIAPTIGPAYSKQHTLPDVSSDTIALLAAAQTFATGTKTFTAAVVLSGGVTASGANANDWSGGSGTFKTSTGAVTIGGGSSAVTITAGAASTWKTTAGALTVDGFGGMNLQRATATLVDVGVTNSAKVTLAAGISLSAAAGATGLDLGAGTGDSVLPAGSISWTAASAKTCTLAATGAVSITSSGGAMTLTAAATSVWSTSAGDLRVDAAGALNLGTTAATSISIGAASVAPNFVGGLTVSASKQVVGAVGTVSAPGFAFTGSLTTGIYSPGANTMALTTNGTQALLLGSSQTATFAGDILSTTKATLASASGKFTKYNNETLATVGMAYILASGQDVASTGAGAQTTALATATTPATGLFRVTIVISAVTNNDTVTAQITFTDAVMAFATTLTPISAVALTAGSNTGTTQASVVIRASNATDIVAKLTISGQSTTKGSAIIERLQ